MRTKATAIGAALATMAVLCAMFASSASAAPAWKFNGTSLTGSETVLGGAYESALTIPGLTTKCENFLYKLTIKNESGTGKGSLTEMPLYNCKAYEVEGETEEVCAVSKIGAEALPWAAHLSTVSSSNYIIIEGVKVGIIYAGEECVLDGTLVTVTGSAGGVINNTNETATFNASTLTATGTSLKALGSKIEWNGVFPTEAFEWHRNEAISVS